MEKKTYLLLVLKIQGHWEPVGTDNIGESIAPLLQSL
jgi:hypothetical protein